jgi:hypothetical protein
MPTSFKVEILKGVHDFTASSGDVFKVALLKATAAGSGTFGAATTNYSDLGADQLPTATGYTQPGNTLVSITPVADGTTAICDFDNTTWNAATFTTCGGLIYNSTEAGKACAVLNFGGDQTVSSGDFQLQWPVAAAATAIIRIA